ncbi:unnamed protein product [Urochloa humidicola]
MGFSGCKALLLAALIVASSRLLHGPAGCSEAGAVSPKPPALPPAPGVGGKEEARQSGGDGDGEALPFLRRGERVCFPAGAVGRFYQAMLVVLLARGGGRMAAGRWRSSRRRG